ncbi:GNAT family protein [Phytomonospora sp. NPDC050363]|uniref:GNAT family N-acetyltransferase n=1 Tax=Phytomonospora sp. NPDC050363 TaxID=3155642 RepID=UPI00340DAA0F
MLSDVAAEGVHDPGLMPFGVPWTDGTPAERGRAVVKYHWFLLQKIEAASWTIPFAVFDADGTVLGMQDLGARDFALTGQVGTGSWLGTRFHGGGLGTEMRAAVLHLAFEGLGAQVAVSSAHVDNPASLAVSRKLGYRENGTERVVPRGELNTLQRLIVDRESWERHRTVPVEIHGLDDEVRRMLGIPDDAGPADTTSTGPAGELRVRL